MNFANLLGTPRGMANLGIQYFIGRKAVKTTDRAMRKIRGPKHENINKFKKVKESLGFQQTEGVGLPHHEPV